MSLTVLLNGTNVAPTNVRLRANGDQGVGGLAASADGVGSQGAITFDDSDSTLAVAGWDPVIAVEAECVTAQRLFTGWIADHTEQRGDHYLLDGGRQIDCSINDTNVLLSNVVVTGSDGNRPAETDAQTIAWLLSTYLSGIVYDLGLVNPPPRDFDAADYRTMTCADVLAALVAPRGQIFFTYWDQSANKIGLFYDAPTATAFTSTLSISNVLADVNGTTVFAPYMDDEQAIDPSEVYCQVYYLYKGGRVLVHDATTHAAFFAGIGHRTRVVENDRVGLRTTATTFATRILAQASEERPLLRFTVLLPATKVGLIQAGHRLAVRFSHLTGFTASTYTRVERLTVAPVASNDHLYEMNLECSTHGPITPIGGGGTGGFPPNPEPASIVQTGCGSNLGSSVDLIFPNPIAAGDMLVAWITSRGTSTDVSPPDSSWTTVAEVQLDSAGNPWNSPCAMYYKIADSTEDGQTSLQFGSTNGSSRPKILGWELAGVGAATQSVSSSIQAGTPQSLPSLTVGAGIAIAGFGTGSDNPEPASISPFDHFYVEAGDHFWPTAIGADRATTSGSVTFSQSFTVSGGNNHWAGVAAFFPADSSGGSAPGAGTPVIDEFVANGDGTTVTFTTAYPYEPLSLRVKVDGVQIILGLTETSPTAGTFTLDFAPLGVRGDVAAEKVTVSYIATGGAA